MRKVYLLLIPVLISFLSIKCAEEKQTEPPSVTPQDVECLEVEPDPLYEDTIYLNIDPRDSLRWQLAHVEAYNEIKPFALLTKVKAERKNEGYKIKKMIFSPRPFFGNYGYYRIIRVRRGDSVGREKGMDKYDIHITVGTRDEGVVNLSDIDTLEGLPADRNSIFDFHVEMTPRLKEFVECSFDFRILNKELLIDEDDFEPDDDIGVAYGCCGVICRVRFVYTNEL